MRGLILKMKVKHLKNDLDDLLYDDGEDMTFFIVELNLMNNPRRVYHSERIKRLENKCDKRVFKMTLYEDKTRPGLYHLHFSKKIGELQHA